MKPLDRFLSRIFSEQAQPVHLFWVILGMVTLSFSIESLIEVFLLPTNTLRWLMVIGVTCTTALVLYFLSRAGYVKQSSLALVGVLWALVTVLALTDNGVRSPTIDIAYLVIILVAGLLLGERAGVFTGIACILTLFGLAIAGKQGLLPAGQVNRGILTTWEADIFYLAMVVGLQYLAIHSIKQALSQAHAELTERRRVEANLQEVILERTQNQMRLELQRLLTDHLEQERLRLARDLHDGPVQDLVAVTFLLQGLIEDSINQAEVPHLRENLEEIQTSLQEQIHGLRGFAAEMRSPTLVKFGLEQAIREHLDKFQAKHPDIAVQFEPALKDLPLKEDTRLAMFRIYQEAMNNVVRHAQATRVEVCLAVQEQQVQLAVRDNGVGFNPPQEWLDLARQGHLGLVGMRERVEAIGGRFEMDSRVGKGTTLKVSVER